MPCGAGQSASKFPCTETKKFAGAISFCLTFVRKGSYIARRQTEQAQPVANEEN